VRRRFMGSAVLLVAVAIAAGCGGSDSSSEDATTEWANSLCSSILTWTNSISQIGETLTNDPSVSSLQSAAEEAQSATETFVDDLKDAGKPELDAADEVQQTVSTLTDQLSTDVAAIEEATQGLSGVAGLPAAVTAIVTSLSNMGSQVTAAFSSLEQLDAKGELEDAFTQASACSDLTN
jgi:prophage DNA circulation protein